MGDYKLDPDYNEVKDRIVEFRAKFPEGSLQSDVIRWPEDGFPFIAVKAWAYRTADDPRPGIGLAWEDYPGKTNFTRGSELMNSETSAWGRALIAVGAADAKKGIASAQEVRRAKEPAQQTRQPQPEGGTRAPNDSGKDVAAPRSTAEDETATSSPTLGGGRDGGHGDAPRPSSTCAHEYIDAPRAGFVVCTRCGKAQQKPKATLL